MEKVAEAAVEMEVEVEAEEKREQGIEPPPHWALPGGVCGRDVAWTEEEVGTSCRYMWVNSGQISWLRGFGSPIPVLIWPACPWAWGLCAVPYVHHAPATRHEFVPF